MGYDRERLSLPITCLSRPNWDGILGWTDLTVGSNG